MKMKLDFNINYQAESRALLDDIFEIGETGDAFEFNVKRHSRRHPTLTKPIYITNIYKYDEIYDNDYGTPRVKITKCYQIEFIYDHRIFGAELDMTYEGGTCETCDILINLREKDYNKQLDFYNYFAKSLKFTKFIELDFKKDFLNYSNSIEILRKISIYDPSYERYIIDDINEKLYCIKI